MNDGHIVWSARCFVVFCLYLLGLVSQPSSSFLFNLIHILLSVTLILFPSLTHKIHNMPQFDEKKAYVEQEETVFFDDGREIELLHYIYGRDDIEQLRDHPDKVLQAIDDFGRTKKYLMNVGEDKGKIVTDLIAEVKPKVMVCFFSFVAVVRL